MKRLALTVERHPAYFSAKSVGEDAFEVLASIAGVSAIHVDFTDEDRCATLSYQWIGGDPARMNLDGRLHERGLIRV